ncbi:right-handed parallel beta-helix repeat-containing protein [Acetatifactor muris]|uniref:right-handed parallel beta-helix repeat-containing protein n=1 Tax=Acetatifactor muris TaxID=879566 RepID=UPI0023F43380|nr:right-handed parallel beta-helix repeat-containing protein [Acetatifactor muris]
MDREIVKQNIYNRLSGVEKLLADMLPSEEVYLDIHKYIQYVRKDSRGLEIWTDAFNVALREEKAIYIPKAEQPYYIDGSVIIPSQRHIRADEDTVIRQLEGVRVLMFRNEHTVDGTNCPPGRANRDSDISITGGRWEESYTSRAGYGKSGMYDDNRSFYGVSTCMLFNNIENLSLRNMTFAHTAGFAVQAAEMENAIFENITFENCYADGLHINGNSENLIIRNIAGEVGDDLVALNMYDWKNSSVNFGPARNVLCENLRLAPNSRYKALRISPGVYYFEDGSGINCAVENFIIKNVSGIHTFKLYLQTPRYRVGEEPGSKEVGSGDNLFFEDITIDLTQPVDKFEEYLTSDRVRGAFAGFEIGTNIDNISFDNINIRLYQDRYPMSFLACVGPKSIRTKDGWEIFDPYVDCKVKNLHAKNIVVNGEKIEDIRPYIYEIVFDDVYGDGLAVGKGVFERISS